MELVVIGNTTDVDDKKLRNVTAPDGTIYMERRLTLSFEFVGGLFTKIEQNEEYTGNTSTDQMNYYLNSQKNYYVLSGKHLLTISYLLFNVQALSLMADLSGYLGLFLGYSLLQISGPLTVVWMHFRY
jgi:hypothetical protein